MFTRLAAAAIGLAGIHLCLAAALLNFLAPQAVAQTQETGAIQGRVLNVASGSYLENARITVGGTNLETFTNDIGEYRLPSVAAGEVRLAVMYTGMEPQTTVLRVTPRQTLRQDFSLALAGRQADGSIVQLEKFTVQERELTGLAVALHERRNAPNIKNVVSLDEFGDMGEGNVGDFLKYVPGVSVQYFPQTPGSASVRGMPSSGTLVMVNGAEMASPALTRGFDLGMSASGNIDRVEISKVPTPEMPANAVGGSINMIPKSGFSRSKPLLSYNLFLTHNALEGVKGIDARLSKKAGPDPESTVRYVQPAFNLSYIWPVKKTLAFTFALSKAPRYSDYEYVTSLWDRVRMIETQYRFGTLVLGEDRELAAATVDWKIAEKHLVQASFQASNQNYITRQHYLYYNAGANATGGPGFTQGAPTGVGNLNPSFGWTGQDKTLRHSTMNYRYEGSVWKFEGNAAFSTASLKRSDTEDGYFANIVTTVPNLVMRWEGTEGINPGIIAKVTATDRTGASVNVFDARNYPITGATINPAENDDQIARVGINGRRSFDFSFPVSLKAGALFNRQTKDTTGGSKTLEFVPPGGAAARLAGNYDLVAEGYSNRHTFTDASGATLSPRWLSPYKMFNLYKEHPDWFVFSPANQVAAYTSAVNLSKKLEETISAAYVRGDVKLINKRLWLVGGVRYERTMDKGWGPLNDLRGVYQQDASGNLRRDAAGRLIPVTTDLLERAKLQYTERGAFAERSYDGFFPSVNTSFEITENLILRAAYARTLGRPELAEVIPGVSVTDPDAATQNRTITVVNAGLKPWFSNNYDLTLESYGFKGAVTTLSLFRKDISNFFGTIRTPATPELLAEFGFSDDYLNYDVITKRNFGAASIDGFEIGYRQSLLFLPAWGRGLQVYFNLTSLRLSGPNAEDFTNFSPRDISWGLSYAHPKFIGKLNIAQFKYIRQSPLAVNATTPPNTYSYIGPQTRIDLSLEYRFSRKLALYGSVRNLAVSIKRSGRYNDATPDYAKWDLYQKSGALFTLGLKGEF